MVRKGRLKFQAAFVCYVCGVRYALPSQGEDVRKDL
nr:MAG TPA: zinc finger domain protein [Inoviridae sp.]